MSHYLVLLGQLSVQQHQVAHQYVQQPLIKVLVAQPAQRHAVAAEGSLWVSDQGTIWAVVVWRYEKNGRKIS